MAGRTAATGEIGSTKGYFDHFASEGTVIGRIKTHSAFKKAEKIVYNRGNIKKACQITYKSIGVYNVMHKVILYPELVKGLKGIVDVIDFYGSYKNIVYWINVFSRKPSVDRDRLEGALTEKLKNVGGIDEEKNLSEIVNDVMLNVFDQVGKDCCNEEEIRAAFKNALIANKYNNIIAEEIAEELEIPIVREKQSRPVPELVLVFCFTVGDLIDNVVTLKKYAIFDYTVLTAKIAAKVGTDCPVFTFFYELGAGKIIGSLNSLGLIVALGSTTHKLILVIRMYIDEENQEKRDKLFEQGKDLAVRWVTTAVDLGVCVAPLLFTVNPPLLLSMAVCAKGLGLAASCWRALK